MSCDEVYAILISDTYSMPIELNAQHIVWTQGRLSVLLAKQPS